MLRSSKYSAILSMLPFWDFQFQLRHLVEELQTTQAKIIETEVKIDALAVKKIWFDIFSIKFWNNAETLIISSLYYMDREAEIFEKARTIWSKKQLKKNVSCNRIGN